MQTEHGFEQGLIAAETIVQTRHPATALICASDYLALGALRGLVKHGVKVPQDMSIISFNDNDFAAFTVPSLSTVRLPIREVGCKAGHYLLDCLGEPLGEDEYLLEPTLKARESSAPVRARTL
ncbi:putative HTH-type transcriptional repressor ExuR [bioreactor metagenome]|uniref:Putative HTH-type transcriptional repressor ExuR n=1 Tax=bioreactor metagenome TaxID=1076179 RepID=A0A645FB28_9ZZZZ